MKFIESSVKLICVFLMCAKKIYAWFTMWNLIIKVIKNPWLFSLWFKYAIHLFFTYDYLDIFDICLRCLRNCHSQDAGIRVRFVYSLTKDILLKSRMPAYLIIYEGLIYLFIYLHLHLRVTFSVQPMLLTKLWEVIISRYWDKIKRGSVHLERFHRAFVNQQCNYKWTAVINEYIEIKSITLNILCAKQDVLWVT